MFNFQGTRKPDFKNLENFNYNYYWKEKSSLRGGLREREHIFFDSVDNNSKVLDVACGMSRLLVDLKNKKECKVWAFDISKNVIEAQKKKELMQRYAIFLLMTLI